MATLTVRVPDSIDRKLSSIAKRTQRPKSFYLRAIIESGLAEMENEYKAHAVKKLSAKTKKAMAESLSGKMESFGSSKELFKSWKS